jgi:hypothetical protein
MSPSGREVHLERGSRETKAETASKCALLLLGEMGDGDGDGDGDGVSRPRQAREQWQ